MRVHPRQGHPGARRLGAVFAGGAAGTLARVLLAELVVHDPGRWPWATLAANLMAAGLLGYLTVRVRHTKSFPALGPGLCGGLSTFSALQLELLWMLDSGHVWLAVTYTVASVALGLAAVSRRQRDRTGPGRVIVLALIAAAVLGGLGAVARVVIDDTVMARLAPESFPVGTLVVNLTGTLALGVLVGAGVDGDALRLAGVGLLGGYTTFSTWMLDTDRMAGDGRRRRALANVAISLLAGLVAVWVGRELGMAL